MENYLVETAKTIDIGRSISVLPEDTYGKEGFNHPMKISTISTSLLQHSASHRTTGLLAEFEVVAAR
jgi:hypothetical protein